MDVLEFCKNCLNSRFKTHNDLKKYKLSNKFSSFSKKGLCNVCLYELKKKNIDWDKRIKTLKKIVKFHKKKSSKSYECIVPVSGGKDSLRQAIYVRDKLKLKALLVSCSWPPEQSNDIGPKNLENLVSLGFDCINLTLNPNMWKDLMRHSFFEFGNIFRASEMALFAIPIHFAIQYKIPLIFYGENPFYTVVHGSKEEGVGGDASKIQEMNTIKGGPKSLKFKINKKNNNEFYFYNYPNYKDMKKNSLKLVYLGFYIKNWYGKINGKIAINRGLSLRKDKPINTGDLWGISALDEDFKIVNQYLKFLKLGIGHVTDQVCESINLKEISRKKGKRLVEKYDGKCSKKYINKFCKYINITNKEFDKTVNKFVNKKLFKKIGNNWIRKFDYN